MYFTRQTYKFLAELALNNDKAWFQDNRARYEEHVKGPALRFIADFEPLLRTISPELRAVAKASGGSLFRIHRDTRFSNDKTPYKTNIGMHFPHRLGKDAHAPGYYLHLEPGDVGVAVGIWQPDAATLRTIRDAIVGKTKLWQSRKKAVERAGFELWGEQLKRPPRGYDPAHPCIDDLRRKHFVAWLELSEKDSVAPDFLRRFAAICKRGAPFAEFLCGALGLRF